MNDPTSKKPLSKPGHSAGVCIILFFAFVFTLLAHSQETERPNIILIFCDDLGYGDLGVYGSKVNRTPRIDGLAEEGIVFTDFYSSSPVCTPSRASLLTGCYARRVDMHEDQTGHWVLIPRSVRGLNPKELTIAEALKSVGYATACIGKWHLGDQPDHLPTRHGFDTHYGIPYSNDMQQAKRGDPPLPLVRQETVFEAPADQSTLTQRYTQEAIKFIEANRENPFFLYLPHTFPHLPLFASPAFKDKSANGRYGDSVEEIDWSTAQILDTLDRLGIDQNTLVIFTSDNGSNGRNGGSNAPLAGRKGSTMEGGMRVPMIARWPERIPAASICDELATTMDFLPTFCAITGAEGPALPIDGHDIQSLFYDQSYAQSPYKVLYYYRRRQLQAVRWGDWKYHLELGQTHPNWTTPDILAEGRPAKLVNLASDLQETTDLSDQHPDIVRRMKALAREAIRKLGNDDVDGSLQRQSVDLTNSTAMTFEN
ncbi:MAG TPA: arylsulfatase [Opitutae bacterium]|nr:arylsulfatase [Opitutaceae bacterium]HCR29307.1 arylsulfatase [Opitutae bacterium]